MNARGKRAASSIAHGAVALWIGIGCARWGAPAWSLPAITAGIGCVWEYHTQRWLWAGSHPDGWEWFGFVVGGAVAAVVATVACAK